MRRVMGLVLTMGLLQGCAAVAVGGIVGSAAVLTDDRTLGVQLDDQTLEVKLTNRVDNAPNLAERRVVIASMNQQVLLVGQVTRPEDKATIAALIKQDPAVKKVVNYLQVGPVLSLAARNQDAWLTTQVRTELFLDKTLKSGKMKVVTEDKTVFLLGLVTSSQSKVAVQRARYVPEVKKVVQAFELLPE